MLGGTEEKLEPPGPHFINVDLDILGRVELATLAEALQHRSVVLFAGKTGRKFRVSIEASRSYVSPESTIWALLRLLGSLSPPLESLVERADSRTFSIGYSAGSQIQEVRETPPGSGVWKLKRSSFLAPHQTLLSPKLLRAVADLDARIETIVYPATRENRARKRPH